MPFAIATSLRNDAVSVRIFVQAYRGLRRDTDPQSPYTGQLIVTSLAPSAETARVFADRAEAARVCDNLIGSGASGAHVVEI